MCGITGVALRRGAASRQQIEAMRDVLAHRGPDGAGLFIKDNIALGHRRLSIVDVAHGQQPMTNEDGSLHVVFNGEIYNHADYRKTLEARGHVYQSHCDTETILHLFEEYGEAAVHRMRGMFAFAIWDERRKRLFLARDRLGVKPLYYKHCEDGSLYFASEIKSLLASKAFHAEINIDSLPDYLANHATSGDATLFNGIRRLLPGHSLTWTEGEITIREYWNINKDNALSQLQPMRSREYASRWLELFRESVKLRLMADVPLGAFLSGGIDSSAIVAMMTSLMNEPVKTFSVAFAEREANELEYARLVARTFKTDHHEVIVSPEAFFARLPDLVWHEDEPLAHPSSVALNFVSELAAGHVKVALSGEGSDEMLAGYERYRKTIANVRLGRAYNHVTSPSLRTAIASTLDNSHLPGVLRKKLHRTFLFRSPSLADIYFDNFSVFSRDMQSNLLSPAVLHRIGKLDPYRTSLALIGDVPTSSLLNQLLYVDSKLYLQELLMKQDQMSMAASIETRVPFLDHELCQFSWALPDRMKLHGWTTKYVLRQAMAGILPAPILSRSKMGFPVPLASWFRGSSRWVIEEFVLGGNLGRGIFDESMVRQLVAQHLCGGSDHSQRLWSLVNFEIWCRRFIDR